MGMLLLFPVRHPAPAAVLKPNNCRSAVLPADRKASSMITKRSEGMAPRAFQLLCPVGPTPVSRLTAAGPPKAEMTESIVSSMDSGYSHSVKSSTLHAMDVVTICELLPNAGMARSAREVSERLEITREALGISAAELCRRAGIKQNAWSQFVNPKSKRTITRAAAYRLKDEFGITLDWTYDGDPSGLPVRIHAAIRARSAA